MALTRRSSSLRPPHSRRRDAPRSARQGARRPSFNLFVMDSGDYPEKTGPEWPGYDGCRSDQIAWYERVSGKAPCLWFQHIIVPDANGIRLGMTKCCTFWSYNDNAPGVRVHPVRQRSSMSRTLTTLKRVRSAGP